MFVIIEFDTDEKTATLIGDYNGARVFKSREEAHEFVRNGPDSPYEVVELLEVLGAHREEVGR